MSDENLAQPPDAPSNVVDLAAYRASRSPHRTQLAAVLAPTLAALREYRRQVAEHCDRTIERLEALEPWVAGGDLPQWTSHCAELFERFHRENEMEDAQSCDAAEELNEHYFGPVWFCETALEELAAMAVDAERAKRGDESMERIVGGVLRSSPNRDCAPPDEVLDAFDQRVVDRVYQRDARKA